MVNPTKTFCNMLLSFLFLYCFPFYNGASCKFVRELIVAGGEDVMGSVT